MAWAFKGGVWHTVPHFALLHLFILKKQRPTLVKRDVYLLGPILILGIYTVLFSATVYPKIIPYAARAYASPQIYFLSASAIFIWLTKAKLHDVYLAWPNSPTAWLFTFLLSLVPFVFLGAIHFLLTEPIASPLPCYRPNWLSLLILAPISEELLFRGLLLRGLLTRFSKTRAVILGSLIFMLAHGLWAFGPLCLGLITGWLTLRYGSMLPGIIFHAISNTYMPLTCTYDQKTFYFLRSWIYLRDLF